MAELRQLRLLVVRVGAMGDVLHGLPAVTALRNRLPDAFLGWAVDPRWAPLLQGAGGVLDRVHPADTTLWKQRPVSTATVRSLRMLDEEMRRERYDLCVDLQGTLRSALLGRLSGAARRLGPAHPRESLARAFYTEPVPTRARSVILQACELVGAAMDLRLASAAVSLPVDAAAERWAANWAGSEPFVLFAPSAGWGAKCWPAERYARLAPMLEAQGLRVVVNAAETPGGREDTVAREVAQAAGCERVRSSVAELVALARRASLVVGGDTGPVHLAAALGRPTLALFGPTDPERNGPCFAGARVTVLRAQGSVTTYKRTTTANPDMGRITAEEAFGAAEALLRGVRQETPLG